MVEHPPIIIKKQWFVSSREGNIKEEYSFEKKLGEGGYGAVYQATHIKKGIRVAIKAIRKQKVRDYQTFQTEISILRDLDHPNILKIYETWETDNICFLVAEVCDGGELFYYITKKKHLTEGEASLIMKQMLSSIKYCHENKIIHRDLKPENFLLKDVDDITNIKLIDFGLSEKMEEVRIVSTPNGTPYYIAPEVLEGRYSESCDNWALGVILYIFICGRPPFAGKTNTEIVKKVQLGEYHMKYPQFKTCSAEVISLIDGLLTKDPEKRMSATEAYDHPWIKNQLDFEKYEIGADVFENLTGFQDLVNLKKTTLTFIASKIPEEEISKLRAAFIKLDVNGDGKLTIEELKNGAKQVEGLAMKVKEADWDTVMKAMDTNKNGFLDYTEFIAAALHSKQQMKEVYLKEAFEHFDKDNNGQISLEELKAILNDEITIQDEEIQRMLKEIDTDKDGQISYEEFKNMMIKNHILE